MIVRACRKSFKQGGRVGHCTLIQDSHMQMYVAILAQGASRFFCPPATSLKFLSIATRGYALFFFLAQNPGFSVLGTPFRQQSSSSPSVVRGPWPTPTGAGISRMAVKPPWSMANGLLFHMPGTIYVQVGFTQSCVVLGQRPLLQVSRAWRLSPRGPWPTGCFST